MGKKKAKNDPYHMLSDSSSSSSDLDMSSSAENQVVQMSTSRSAPSSPLTTKNEGSIKKWSPIRRKHSRSKSADDIETDYILPSTQAVLDDLKEASAGGFPQFEIDDERTFPLIRDVSSASKKSHSSISSSSEEKPSASAIKYFASLPPPPPPPKGILRLAKKGKKQQKMQSSGIVNYGISGNSDSESEASSVSATSEVHGYALPYAIQKSTKNRTNKESIVSDSSNSDDDLSVRTPIPKAPPDASSSVMPSAFLRDHHTSSNRSSVSDLSEEEESVTKRHKRELQNVGRLVQAAKQQQSFAQAWFSAGKGDNVLPQLQPRTHTSRKSSDERSAGPIDVDSGESWEEPGSFTFNPSIQKSKGFITFGGGGDDGNKWCGRVICTVGNTRCTLLACILIVIVIMGATAGSTIAGIMLYPNTPDSEIIKPTPVSPMPSVSIAPTISPSYLRTQIPSNIPSVKVSEKPSPKPSLRPSAAPSQRPTVSPSSSPSHFPSKFPSSRPTDVPSILPTHSQQPSLDPSNSPTTFFSTATYTKVGGDVRIVDSISNDRSGQSVKLSKDGNTMIIGSLRYPNLFGSVRIYERLTSESSWISKGQRLDGSQIDSGAGEVVDISDDGLRVVMSEYGTVNGTVKVYDYNNNTSRWEQVGENIEGEGGNFGFSLSLSGDGQRVAVGAHGKGEVVVYSLDANFQWKQVGRTLSNSYYFGGNFGWSVSLSKNGEVLAIGAPDAAGETNILPEGFVEVYEYKDIDWIPRGTQVVYGQVFFEIRFGFSVSLNEDGSLLAVGANQNSFMTNNQFKSGSVTVYSYNSLGYWQKVGEDLLGIPSSSQEFGYSVSLSRNGKQVAVGAPYSGSGKVFIYRYNGIMWDQSRVLEGENPDEFFGFSVDVQEDTSGCLSLVAIGAPGTTLRKGVTRTYQVNYVGPCPIDL